MNTSTLFVGALALCTASVSCKKKDAGDTTGSAGAGSSAPMVTTSGPAGDKAGGTINGSGSTFQSQFQQAAIEAFGKTSAVKVNYGGGGSGKGRQDFADMVTDYGCADAPYKDEDKAKVKGGEFIYVPVLLGAITISYNVPSVDKLQLSADTIAKIFDREIKKWNDPAIAADNPGVKLPDATITVAHRADGSGTTEQFTNYLVAASPAWKLKSGATIEWPSDTQAGQGNGGVAQIIKSTSGAIGYVDLPDAKGSGLHYAMVKNQAGKFIEPTSDSASAAGAGVDVKDDLTFTAVNAKGDAAYPITAPSWCMSYTKPAKNAAAVKAYFKFMVGDGQNVLKDLDFAPLPKTLQEKAAAAVDKIQG